MGDGARMQHAMPAPPFIAVDTGGTGAIKRHSCPGTGRSYSITGELVEPLRVVTGIT
jgi:hypothetical protein